MNAFNHHILTVAKIEHCKYSDAPAHLYNTYRMFDYNLFLAGVMYTMIGMSDTEPVATDSPNPSDPNHKKKRKNKGPVSGAQGTSNPALNQEDREAGFDENWIQR